jgi:hypothetical protein
MNAFDGQVGGKNQLVPGSYPYQGRVVSNAEPDAWVCTRRLLLEPTNKFLFISKHVATSSICVHPQNRCATIPSLITYTLEARHVLAPEIPAS